MTDDDHNDSRQATGDARLTITNRVQCTHLDERRRSNERTNELYPATECAAKKAHLLERWLAEGSRGDCTQGSAEKGVKRRGGEGMEDGRSA